MLTPTRARVNSAAHSRSLTPSGGLTYGVGMPSRCWADACGMAASSEPSGEVTRQARLVTMRNFSARLASSRKILWRMPTKADVYRVLMSVSTDIRFRKTAGHRRFLLQAS
jgi:hypothetical protein